MAQGFKTAGSQDSNNNSLSYLPSGFHPCGVNPSASINFYPTPTYAFPSGTSVPSIPNEIDVDVILRFGKHESHGSIPLSRIYDFSKNQLLDSEARAKEVGVFEVETDFRSHANNF